MLYLKTICSLILLIYLCYWDTAGQQNIVLDYTEESHRIINQALYNNTSFDKLTQFVDTFGHRFSGSERLENSLDWIINELKKEGYDVYTQDVTVPRWIRGEESLQMIVPNQLNIPMLGLGGSIGTGKKGITAEVMVVSSFIELEKRADEAEGKIVLYHFPFTSYGETRVFRTRGAIEAAKAGAVASLIRSLGPYSMQTPHTGGMDYEENVKKIPHAAITVEHAKMIQRMKDRGESVRLKLNMEAETRGEAVTRNVIAEIKGTEHPEEVVVVGGHIDSWDVGQGAMDDAGGTFAAWEVLNIIRDLNLQPKRTVRLVMWTAEEIGLYGARKYRDIAQKNNEIEHHVLAIESDGGVFNPKGFGFAGNDEQYSRMVEIGKLLKPIDASLMNNGGGAPDITPLVRENVPGAGLLVDNSKYFWYHHTGADTIDKLNREDYNKCVAAMAVLTFVAADMDESLQKL